MPSKQKTIKVTAIKNGTVIDHIPAGKGVEILNHLNINNEQNEVVLGINFGSEKNNKKDVLKIEKKEFTPEELNQLAVFATGATVNIIRNFEVSDKFDIELPEIFHNIIKCPNPNCITNHEEAETRFIPIKNKPLKVECLHCEKIFCEQELTLK